MILLMAMAAATVGPDAAIGRWQTETKHGIIEITPCGASLCGKLVASDGLRANPDLRDIKNKDEAQRGRKLAGIQMLWGFTRAATEWTGGKVYNPDDGGTYKATLTPTDPNHLTVKGCWLFICQNQNWTRVH